MSPAAAPTTEVQQQGLAEPGRTGELWPLLLTAEGTAAPGNHKVEISAHTGSTSFPPTLGN